tara:strand:+ start:129 stop:401 length:273 start_codon:yes stop_codon:yes gene_type:complete
MKKTPEEAKVTLRKLTEEEDRLLDELLRWHNELLDCVYKKDQMIKSGDNVGAEIAEAQIVYSVSEAVKIRERLSDILILKNVCGRAINAN